MRLPVIPLPTKEVGGIRIYGLSRAASLHVGFIARKGDDDTRTEEERLTAAEVYLLAQGCQVTEAEASAWREATLDAEVEAIADAIREISAMRRTTEDADPQP